MERRKDLFLIVVLFVLVVVVSVALAHIIGPEKIDRVLTTFFSFGTWSLK